MCSVCSSGSTIMQSALWLLTASIILTFRDTEAKSCSGRQVYNASYGVITDGFEDYPASAHCEWLIHGKSPL